MIGISKKWWIFRGEKSIADLPEPPSWRFKNSNTQNPTVGTQVRPVRGQSNYIIGDAEIEIINAAIYLRRPLLVTGKPGTGKTALAKALASELGLGNILTWPITTQSSLQDGLYQYDAIARLQNSNLNDKNNNLTNESVDIKNYLRLGPLGTSFVENDYPRVLLIDEIDKSDIDLPNNLLHVFEEGEFEIPELVRLKDVEQEVSVYGEESTSTIIRGKVSCKNFPIVIMTSNAEREFPAAFMRRCICLDIEQPDESKLNLILKTHFGELKGEQKESVDTLIKQFLKERDNEGSDLATDQLLNVAYLTLNGINMQDSSPNELKEVLWKSLQS